MLSRRGFARTLALVTVALAAAFLAGRASAVPPANDAFDAAVELTGRSVTESGSNKDATKESGEPDHADEPGGASVWFRWTAPAGGEATVDTCGSAFDTLLAVYTGSAVNALTEVGSNDDECGLQSRVVFAATEGTTYRIAVDGLDAETGIFQVQLRLAPPNDSFANAVEVSGDQGSVPGTNAGASNEADEPSGVAKSVWYRWAAPSSGWASFSTCGSPFDTTIGVYRGSSLASLEFVAYSDDACGAGSRAVFEAVQGVTYQIAVGGFAGDEGDFTLAWNRNPPAPYALEYPSIGGIAREGQTLTGSEGQWGGSPTSFAFAWGRCDAPVDECELIPGATGQTYFVTPADIGNRLFLEVTAANAGGSSTAYSDVTAVVRPGGPANTAAPEVFGTAAVGRIVDASTGTWTGLQPIQYAYQWQACNAAGAECLDLAGERSSSLAVRTSHLGARLRVVVTASNADGARSAASATTGIVVRGRRTQTSRCVVPKLRGKTLREARAAIVRGRCRVGRVERRFSSRLKAGRVISQRPRAGSRLPVRSRVNVVVSRGKRR
ncbi:MAG TPA: PASTA domain-containing protein [Gaiellaceae bacterium]|nr:PASTA domain-containing protein [Gaiellaceae bacterium]